MKADTALLVEDPQLKPLWVAAHRRLEETGGNLATSVRLGSLGDNERRAVDLLIGRRSRGGVLVVKLDDLDALLRRSVQEDLRGVLEVAVGPLRDRPAERQAARNADAATWDAAAGHNALTSYPFLEGWLERLRSTGRLKRNQQPGESLMLALDVLARLPADPPVQRSTLAVSVCRGAHALDDGEPTGRLVLGALAHLAGDERAPATAAGRRALWESQGVRTDETSSTVLTLGLRPMTAGPLTEAATRWADGRVALPLPWAAVRAESWRVPQGTPVWVCENPSILAAAASHDRRAAVVCVEGQPSLAAVDLLITLRAGGAVLRYHGDFGSGGIAIANIIIGRLGAAPWRFRAEDHAEAVEVVRSEGTTCRPLKGVVPEAVWDDGLAASIRAAGFEIEEEHLTGVLLDDLDGDQGDQGS